MSELENPIITPDTQTMMDCLRQAVSKTLERKRRLGHYSVQWSDNAPILVGDDAPEYSQASQQSDKVLSPESH